MAIGGVEGRRKAVHIGMGGFALLLPLLGWKGGALAALGALLFNLTLLPRLVGTSLSREGEESRKVPVGIVLYPVTVLALILLFRNRLEIAAAGWGFLAFGDGFATLIGKAAPSPPLPWNPRKSTGGLLAYVVWGGAGATLLYRLVAGRGLGGIEILAIGLAAAAGALLESLPSELDDNLVPPIGAALVLALLLEGLATPAPVPSDWLVRAAIALALNTLLPLTALALRVVRPSGAIAGGACGALVLFFGGWPGYLLLWAFFAIGTVATRLGKKRKEAIGRAEASGGRRGAENVVANVAVAAFLLTIGGISGDPLFLLTCQIAAAAAFATAVMDTVGTEVGQAVQGATFLLPDFRRVPPGTDGAVSLSGTAAGLLAASLIGSLFVFLYRVPWSAAAVIAASACVGTVVESLLGREGAPWRVSNGHVLNLYNTAAGAATAWILLAAA
jgi:uncharacterized protein (TIGR00297 family)